MEQGLSGNSKQTPPQESVQKQYEYDCPGKCQWEGRDQNKACQEGKECLRCTRPKGHEGPHVACGTHELRNHALLVWDKDGKVIERKGF